MSSSLLFKWKYLYYLSLRVKGEDRQLWIPVMESHLRVPNQKTIYICDLHFQPDDLVKNGKSLRPKKNILPQFVDNR